MIKILAFTLIVIFLNNPTAFAFTNSLLITQESWSKHVIFEGTSDNPVIINPLPILTFSDSTKKVVVVPEKLDISEEIDEFTMFRNRYVIFGVYLFASLYYNWLTRHR